MQTYFPTLEAIEQMTAQLDRARCGHCQRTQLVSHGFVWKKRLGGLREAVGKRVFCSNRYQRTGCGRTMQLYLASTLRYLHDAGAAMIALLWALAQGMSVAGAYHHATAVASPRNAYRWWHRLSAQLSVYRSTLVAPLVCSDESPAEPVSHPRWALLIQTIAALGQHFGEAVCDQFQLCQQRAFV
jgi:hypothetical protein